MRSDPLGTTSKRCSAEHGFKFAGRSAEHGFKFAGRSAEHGFTSARRSAEHGFTLIEIMVALAVFSLAVLALVRLEGATARGAGLIDETTVGQLVARNVAITALTEPQPPAPGLVTGSEANGGRSWNWTRRVSSAGDPRVMRVDVAVTNLAGQQVGSMTMIRPPSTAVDIPQVRPSPTPGASR